MECKTSGITSCTVPAIRSSLLNWIQEEFVFWSLGVVSEPQKHLLANYEEPTYFVSHEKIILDACENSVWHI